MLSPFASHAFSQPLADTWTALQQLFVWGVMFFAMERKQPIQALPPLKRDFAVDAAYPFLNIWLGAFITANLTAWLGPHVLDGTFPHQAGETYIRHLWLPARVLLALVFFDCIVYVEHRFEHAFLWPFHAVHHSTPDVTWITAGRVHPVNSISIKLFNFVFLYMVGFDTLALMIAGGIGAVVAMFVHANIDFGFKRPWCHLFISPHYHRWHHAVEREGHYKNFCLMFPFIDRAFGTYHYPEGRLPQAYGLSSAYGPQIPGSFIRQLWYPFAYCFSRMRRRAI